MPKKTKDFINHRQNDEIKEFLAVFDGQNGLDQSRNRKTRKVKEKRHFNNVFSGDLSLRTDTTKTQLLKSHLCRTTVEIIKGKLRTPTMMPEPYSNSPVAFEEKELASIVKGIYEWFIRFTAYESQYETKGKEQQIAYGDTYVMPGVHVVKDGDNEKQIPVMEFVDSDEIIIDPNAETVNSGGEIGRAQYFGRYRLYDEHQLVGRFGKWILDYAKPGRIFNNGTTHTTTTKEYEVFEGFVKSYGQEMCLVGENCFPVMVNGVDFKPNLKNIDTLIEEGKVVYSDEYVYKDSFGRNYLPLVNFWCYKSTDSMFNHGVVQKTFTYQVAHQITMNMVVDNVLQKMDQMKVISGGNPDKLEQTRQDYMRKRLTDRNAVWYLPGSAARNGTAPKPEVFRFEGMTYQEGESAIRMLQQTVKNTTGVSVERQEVQSGIGLGQLEILEDEKVESIEDIGNGNIENYREMLKVLVNFCVNHEGFGLRDVEIKFTKYTDPELKDSEGNPIYIEQGMEATMNLVKACERVKEFQYVVDLDKSTTVERGNQVQAKRTVEFLQSINPQVTPEWYEPVARKYAETLGVDLPGIDKERIAQMTPTGGNSQFQEVDNPPMNEVPPQGAPQMPV